MYLITHTVLVSALEMEFPFWVLQSLCCTIKAAILTCRTQSAPDTALLEVWDYTLSFYSSLQSMFLNESPSTTFARRNQLY